MKFLIRSAAFAAAAILLSATTGNSAVPYTVAENPIMLGGISDVAAVDQAAQTFTALQSGELASISVGLMRNGPQLPSQILVDIRLTSGGQPGSILATASIPTTSIGLTSSYPFTADFSAYHVTLSAGSLYALSLRAPDGDLGHAMAAGSGDNYPGGGSYYTSDSGHSWIQQTGYDLTFAVTAVPEPSATALTALAGLILLLTRKTITRRFPRQCSPTT
jgi:hypothetical protein